MSKEIKDNLDATLQMLGMHMELLIKKLDHMEEEQKKEQEEKRSSRVERFASEFAKLNDKIRKTGKEIEEARFVIYKDLTSDKFED